MFLENKAIARQQQSFTRINDSIRVPQVRLIDAEGEQVGVIDTSEAMQMAEQADLDLVEVAPEARPPVCRIMDYGKWKYQQSKKEQKARSHSKQSELKEVRVRPKTDEHDMHIKTERARDFLDEGHKVQFTMLFRGREMAHRDIGAKQCLRVHESVQDVGLIEQQPRMDGRLMVMILAPIKKKG